jgi:hexosaminidase
MSWRGMEGRHRRRRSMGHDVVMCPGSHCYFDYRQSDAPEEHGASWAPVTTLEKVYAFDPTPDELDENKAGHVLGAQGNCWTERMPTGAWVEYMAYPRACALGEVVWSPKKTRDWKDFRKRLAVHLKRLDALKVNYRPLDK